MAVERDSGASLVIDDFAKAVADGITMLPKFPRRWMCKYGALITERPNFSKDEVVQRELFKKLKSEYLEMQKQASIAIEIKNTPKDGYSGIQLHLK
ncbi:hypothetical protein HYO12_05650 [Vibrio parahaemolyticus]|nr:hypothetical protein [Vibrio parahaemolyticus]MBM5024503.1 hypothetical protein [Vibrio parahaemolyticus]